MRGVLHDFIDRETEGVVFWTIIEDGYYGYGGDEGLRRIDAGDHLTVYEEETGRVLFRGIITPDYHTGRRHRPFNPAIRGQVAQGAWVCWIQEGWTADDWGRLFMFGKNRAVLRKNKRVVPFRRPANPAL